MSLFGATSIITFFTSIGFALVVYSSNRKSKLNKSWLTLSIFIAFWSIFLYKVISSKSESEAIFWQYLLDIDAIFIPVLYLNFIFKFLKINSKKLIPFFFFTSFLLSLFSFTSFFKNCVEKIFDFYWINSGPFYFVFPIFFTIIIIISLIYLIKAYLENKNNKIIQGQIRNQLLAGIIGFGGGFTNFFPQLFNIYPFGNYFIILYVFFVSYAVLKYKFLNTKIISTQLFTGVISLIFLFNLLKPSNSAVEWSTNFVIFIMIIIFVILLNRGLYKEQKSKNKIEKLAKKLKIANTRLKKISKQKSEFVSIASHQLRTPIASLKGYTSMILEGSYGPTSPKILDVINKLFKSSQSLSLIIDDFLNLSRIERGKIVFNFTETNLKDLVEQVITEVKPRAEEKHLKILKEIKDKKYIINVDSEKIKQVILNIIDNSIKYTPEGSIEIKLSQTSNLVRIMVRDTGIGLPKDKIGELFQKFKRLDNANDTNIKGTGLGLFLAKTIVEAHKGKIWAESEGRGKGSTFFVELNK